VHAFRGRGGETVDSSDLASSLKEISVTDLLAKTHVLVVQTPIKANSELKVTTVRLPLLISSVSLNLAKLNSKMILILVVRSHPIDSILILQDGFCIENYTGSTVSVHYKVWSLQNCFSIAENGQLPNKI